MTVNRREEEREASEIVIFFLTESQVLAINNLFLAGSFVGKI
jgi:hypothetical protein